MERFAFQEEGQVIIKRRKYPKDDEADNKGQSQFFIFKMCSATFYYTQHVQVLRRCKFFGCRQQEVYQNRHNNQADSKTVENGIY